MKHLLAALALIVAPAAWAEPPVIGLTLGGNAFAPAEVRAPAGQKFHLKVENQTAAPAEFESATLKVEKVIAPGRSAVVRLGPLEPGRYAFSDEFNPKATGTLVVTQE